MNTLDPLDDFYLPGPAAEDSDPEPEAFLLEDDFAGFDDDIGPVAEQRQLRRVAPASIAGGRGEAADGRVRAAASGARGSLLALLLPLALAVAAGWYLAQPETLPIRQVTIQGEFRQLSRTALQQLVGQQLQGGFFSLDVSALRAAVTASPWVRDVQVQRVWPDTLKVSVREQVALARWGDRGLVNSDGDYFEPDMMAVPAGLPRLNGPADTHELLTARLLRIREALAPMGLKPRQLTLSDRRAWSFVTAGGLEVVLGREQFDARLARFVELVPASLGERLGQARYIDMRYTNGFAVRFDDDSGAPAGASSKGNGAA